MADEKVDVWALRSRRSVYIQSTYSIYIPANVYYVVILVFCENNIDQNLSVDGVNATVQELGIHGKPVTSGVISEKTHFIFRSRSTRIIWLVQVIL